MEEWFFETDKKITQTDNIDSIKKPGESEDIYGIFRDFVILLSAFLLVFSLLIRVVVVSGPSMENTLVDGDYLLMLSGVLIDQPKQGDIVVVSTKSFDNGKSIIKRVIATEGQTVDIDFDEGLVYVDGVLLDEPYVKTPTNLYEGVTFPVKVDDGCIFVMGDNRNESKDSRDPEIGQVDCREVTGKAIFLLFPGNEKGQIPREFDRIGVIP